MSAHSDESPEEDEQAPAWGSLGFDRFIMDRRELAENTKMPPRARREALAREYMAIGMRGRWVYQKPIYDKQPWGVSDADAAAVIAPLRSAKERIYAHKILQVDCSVVVRVSYSNEAGWRSFLENEDAWNLTQEAQLIQLPDLLESRNDWRAALLVFPELLIAKHGCDRPPSDGDHGVPAYLQRKKAQVSKTWQDYATFMPFTSVLSEVDTLRGDWEREQSLYFYVTGCFYVATFYGLSEPEEQCVVVAWVDQFGNTVRELYATLTDAHDWDALDVLGAHPEHLFDEGKIGPRYMDGNFPEGII